MSFAQVAGMEVRLKLLLRFLLALTVAIDFIVADDDPCAINGSYEEFLQDIKEDTKVGSVIKVLNFAGSLTEVSLIPSENNFFDFDNETREMKLKAPLDADSGRTTLKFSISCRIVNTTNAPMPNIEVKVKITVLVTDINDNAPKFSQDNYYFNISETLLNGSFFETKVVAKDKDQNSGNSLIYYSIIPGKYSNYFVINDPVTTKLKLVLPLDFRKVQIITIEIMAQDQPQNGDKLNATTTLTFNVIDEDNLPPAFGEKLYEGIVLEKSPPGTVVNMTIPITAKDLDRTLNAPITYSLFDPRDTFAINPVTAEVSVNRTPSAGQVTLVLQATQADNPLRSGVSMLVIRVEEANINAPKFQKNQYLVTVPENSAVETTIVTVVATDPDFGAAIVYAIADDQNTFVMDSKSGSIKLNKNLDFEEQREYNIQVTASDTTFTSTAVVMIAVEDVNDNNPTVAEPEMTVESERETGLIVARINASDTDENTILSYTLTSYTNFFSISQQGVIIITAKPEDLIQNQYDIVAIVNDNGTPPRQTSATVTVKFPPKPVTAAVAMAGQGSEVLAIAFGVLAAVLLILVIILVVYLIKRRLRDSEQLDKARLSNSMDPKGLFFKKHPGSRQPSRVNIHFRGDSDESSDGATTIAKNPFSVGGSCNDGYVISDDSETDRDIDEIQIETAVIPYNNYKFAPNGDSFHPTDDEDSLRMDKLDHSYQNGSLSTFKDVSSNESLHSDSTGSKKMLMTNMNGSLGKKPMMTKKLSWGNNGQIPSMKSLNSIDLEHGVAPIDEKPEITVYF